MTFHKKSMITLLALAALSSGCSVLDHEAAKATAQRKFDDADRQFEQVLQPPTAPRAVENNGVWVNKRSVNMKEEQLPAVFRAQLGISFGGRSSLKDVANLVSRETGLRFAFAQDVRSEVGSLILNAGFSSEEDLRALLNRLTAQQNLSWKYVDGSVEVYRFETKVFQLAVLPGTTEFTSQVSNKSGGGAANGAAASNTTGSTGQESKYTMKLDFWKGLRDDVKGLVQTGSYSVSETNGTITVTGTAQILANVESYVKNLNAMKMRQVAIEVRAYAVEARSSSDFGMSWEAMYTNLVKDIGVTATTPAPFNIGLGTINAVLGPSSSSKWANTKAVISSLSKLGNTTVAAESSQVVLSGESVPISSLRRVGYLSEVSTSTVLNAGTQTSLKQSTETEGFAMTLTPSIINGDYVQINGVLDLASIDRFNTIASGGQIIQTPDVSTRSMPIKIGLRSGETYVFGLRQNAGNTDDSGVLGASTLMTPAGGQHSSSELRKTILVTVSAHIINPSTR
jgi:type IVB pilus formation R64 PilN family outer membrane protein